MSSINENITQEIRNRARELLSSGEAAVFLGYTSGTMPMVMQPFVARSPEDAERLEWNSFCVLNLANYLPGLLKSLEPPRRPNEPPPEGPLPKVGVLATGCWSRNMVVQLQENQIQRDRVIIVGISSRGMIDRRKVAGLVGHREITAVSEQDNSLVVSGPGLEQEINRWDVIRDNCKTCMHPDPVIYDHLIGIPGEEASETSSLSRELALVIVRREDGHAAPAGCLEVLLAVAGRHVDHAGGNGYVHEVLADHRVDQRVLAL
jgi:hypothetical protein